VDQKPFSVFILSAALRRTAFNEIPSKLAGHLRTGSPMLAREIAEFKPGSADLQFGVTTNELSLFPMSHHYSDEPLLFASLWVGFAMSS
jgi:hypothetical protein